MHPTKPILLWDIDGTLVRSSRPVIDAFRVALKQVYRISDGHPLDTAGKTDSQIVRETLAALDHAIIDAGLADFHALYVDECHQR